MQKRPTIYLVSGARFETESNTELVIRPPRAWLSPVFMGVLWTSLSIGLLSAGRDFFLFSIPLLGLAIFFVTIFPLAVRVTFDFLSGQMIFTADYLLRWPHHVEIRKPLTQVVQVSLRPVLKRSTVTVVMADGLQIILQFGPESQEAERLVNRLDSLAGTEAAPLLNTPQALTAATVTGTRSVMYRQLQSWGVWLLVTGAAQMVATKGFSPWGTLLIGLGLASFYFREPTMFLIYMVAMAWAGLSNLLHGDGLWKGFAFLQALWAYQLFQQFQQFQRFRRFRRFRHVQHLTPTEISTDLPTTSERARGLFPRLALILGASSLTVFVLALSGNEVNVLFFKNQVFTMAFGALEIIAVYSGLLGFATGLAGWIAGYPRKRESIVGCILGAVTLIAELGFMLVSILQN